LRADHWPGLPPLLLALTFSKMRLRIDGFV